MESSFKNMVIVLFCITMIASAAVGGVYMVTKEPIAEAKVAATKAALEQVLPPFDSTIQSEFILDAMPIRVHQAFSGDQTVGYAVESETKSGYSGQFNIMVGLTPDGELINIDILSHKETPGLGSKMSESGNNLISSLQGKMLSEVNLKVKKDGGDVDALTAATITSRAYLDAVSRALKAVDELKAGGESNE